MEYDNVILKSYLEKTKVCSDFNSIEWFKKKKTPPFLFF
jgi:hypothetical protein